MIEMKTNTEEGACMMAIEGELEDVVYDVLVFSNAMLKFFEEIDHETAVGFSRIVIEHFQDYLDGNFEINEFEEHKQVQIDENAVKVLQELLEAQGGDVA